MHDCVRTGAVAAEVSVDGLVAARRRDADTRGAIGHGDGAPVAATNAMAAAAAHNGTALH